MNCMSISRFVAALFIASIAMLTAAAAAEPIFPLGSRVGLVPPPGMTKSRNFAGFTDTENKVAMLVVALPAKAFADIEKSMTPEALKKEGVTQESRTPFSLAIGKAFLIIGRQEVGTAKLRKWLLVAAASDITAFVTVQVPETARASYPDDAIRTALASLTIRPQVPDEEKLGLLPFKLSNLAGFKIGSVAPGRGVLLSDVTGEKQAMLTRPRILIAATQATPAQMEDRGALARHLFSTLAGVTEVRTTEAGPLRIGGQQGYQILATGKDAESGTAVTIVQWLRFGGGGFLQLLGISPTKDWTQAYSRCRTVRDSIEPR